MSDNLRLWKVLPDTPVEFTKPITGRGFRGTSINATYTLRALTEIFGPCGIGWKVVIDEEKYIPGHLLKDGNTRAVVHVVRGHLEYVNPETGEWVSTGPQYGQTTFVGEDKNGCYTKEEAPKQSCTDLTTKLACLVGVNSSIFLGLWDDNKYAQSGGEAYTPTNAKAKAQSRGTYANNAASAAPVQADDSGESTADVQEGDVPFDVPESSISIPVSSADWPLEQWGQYFETLTDANHIVSALRQITQDALLKEDIESYALICEVASNRARAVMDKRTTAWKTVLAILTQEKAVIDSRKIS